MKKLFALIITAVMFFVSTPAMSITWDDTYLHIDKTEEVGYESGETDNRTVFDVTQYSSPLQKSGSYIEILGGENEQIVMGNNVNTCAAMFFNPLVDAHIARANNYISATFLSGGNELNLKYDWSYILGITGFSDAKIDSTLSWTTGHIRNLTTGVDLFNDDIYTGVNVSAVSNTIEESGISRYSFSVSQGDLIGASFYTHTTASSREGFVNSGADVIITMSTDRNPVAPEPISSTLFIAGGAVMIARRFKKNKHS